MNLYDILSFKFPTANFDSEIILADRGFGDGPFIKEWNLDTPKPTKQDLEAWESEFDLQYRQKQAIEKRIYPTIGDQLDMLYHDMVNNTTNWKDTIAAIKAAHPKPEE